MDGARCAGIFSRLPPLGLRRARQNTMGMHFFPPMLADETLHSLLSRYHLLSGNSDARATLSLFFGSHTHLATSLLPSHLDDMVRLMPPCLGITRERLLEGSTLLPYYRPFIPAGRLARCESLSGGSNAGALKIGMGMVASRVGGENPFRFCRCCVADELRSNGIGVAYWHRVHQLPGVHVCPTHQEPLWQPDDVFRHRARASLFLPDLAMASSACAPLPVAAHHHDALIRIAALSADLLSSGVQPVASPQLRDFYLEQAQRLGWTNPRRRLHADLVTAAADRLTSSMPQQGDYAFLSERGDGCPQWALQLLRKQRVCIPPLRHLVLLTLLECRWTSVQTWLSSAASGSPAPSNATHATLVAPVTARDRDVGRPREGDETTALTEAMAGLARGQFTLTQASMRAGLSVTTVRILAEREGIALKLKPKKLTATMTSILVTALTTSNPLPAIAAAHGVSQVSLYRVLKARPDLSLQRGHLLREEEATTRRARYMRDVQVQSGRKSSDYMWLYRNDQAFLSAAARHVPTTMATKSRVDWTERDTHFAKVIEESVEKLLRVEPPARLTKTRLALATGRQAVVQKSIERLPLTREAMCRHEEPVAAFLVRRSRWRQGQLGC